MTSKLEQYKDAVLYAHQSGQINVTAAYQECFPHKFHDDEHVTEKTLRECAELDFLDGLQSAAFPKLWPLDDEDYIEAARRMYANPSNDAIEIDSDKVQTSKADDGCWVQAWVWVADTDITDA